MKINTFTTLILTITYGIILLNQTAFAAVQVSQKAEIPLMWYVGRITGIAAFITFTLVVCMGLLMTTKILIKFPFMRAPEALKAHSITASIIGFSLILIHVISLMLDETISLKLVEILVPFTIKRSFTSAVGFDLGIAISLGIVAFYLAIVLIVTSRLRGKLVSTSIWRLTHYSSFLFYLTFIAHGFLVGSDSTQLWMQALYLSSITMVLTLLAFRIFGKKYFIKSASKTSETKLPQVSATSN